MEGPKNQEEKETNHLDSEKSLRSGQIIKSDDDLHEAEANNIGEKEAQKDMISGAAFDLVSQPGKGRNED
jgi:hypothetical protein